jgi:ABC-type sulfate transport system substrate-binding protein
MQRRAFARGAIGVACVLLLPAVAAAQTTILNVSYDVSREPSRDIMDHDQIAVRR